MAASQKHPFRNALHGTGGQGEVTRIQNIHTTYIQHRHKIQKYKINAQQVLNKYTTCTKKYNMHDILQNLPFLQAPPRTPDCKFCRISCMLYFFVYVM